MTNNELLKLLDQAQDDIQLAAFFVRAFAQPNSMPRVERLQERAIEWLGQHGYCSICRDYSHALNAHMENNCSICRENKP